MSGQRRGFASPAAGSELEEAWKRACKYSTAGSRRAACKYSAATMPPSLREDPAFLEAVAASKKEAADKARKEEEAEAEEAAAAIAAVNELIAREAAATAPVVNIYD
jgi:hypothetical protein